MFFVDSVPIRDLEVMPMGRFTNCMASLLILGLQIGGSACAGNTETQNPEGGGWPAIVAELKGGGEFFTFLYVDDPPAGRLLKVSALSSATEPCLLFGGAASPPTDPDDGWLLNVTVSASVPGIYQVRRVVDRDTEFPSQDPIAYAELVSLRDGDRVHAFPAFGGEVIVKNAPGSEQEFASGPVVLVANLVFPTVPVETDICSGAVEVATVTCQCARGFEGEIFTCSGAGPESCCFDGVEEVQNVSLTLQSLPCAAACAYTRLDLASYCASIQ
jgi:hypothetical protein